MRVETDVGRAGAKDPRRDAIERQVLQEIEVLYRVALAITRNHADAEDLVQDTLLRAYRAIDRFDGKHPRAWLLTILRNAHINRNRGASRPTLTPSSSSACARSHAGSTNPDPSGWPVPSRE